MGVPQTGWFIVENSFNIDDLVVPLFMETPILCYIDPCGQVVKSEDAVPHAATCGKTW